MGKLTARGEAIVAGYASLDDTIPAPGEAASPTAPDEAESPETGADPAAHAPGVPDEPRETADDPAADARETREV